MVSGLYSFKHYHHVYFCCCYCCLILLSNRIIKYQNFTCKNWSTREHFNPRMTLEVASSGRLRRCSFWHISVGFILQSRKLLRSVSCKISALKFMPLSCFIDRIQCLIESEWEIGKEVIPAVKSFTQLWLLLVTSPDLNWYSNNVTTLW